MFETIKTKIQKFIVALGSIQILRDSIDSLHKEESEKYEFKSNFMVQVDKRIADHQQEMLQLSHQKYELIRIIKPARQEMRTQKPSQIQTYVDLIENKKILLNIKESEFKEFEKNCEIQINDLTKIKEWVYSWDYFRVTNVQYLLLELESSGKTSGLDANKYKDLRMKVEQQHQIVMFNHEQNKVHDSLDEALNEQSLF